jgi:hypothetical protein
VGYAELMGRRGVHIGFGGKKSRERHHSKELGLDDRIILKRIFKE